MPNPRGVSYKWGRDATCQGCCTLCGEAQTGHPTCGACGIRVGTGHLAEETREAVYAPVLTTQGNYRVIRDQPRQMSLCPSCYRAATTWQESQAQGTQVEPYTLAHKKEEKEP